MTSLFLLLASALFQQIKMHVTCKVGKGLTAVIYKTFQQITQIKNGVKDMSDTSGGNTNDC